MCYGVMLIINDVIGVIVVNLYVDNGIVVRVDAGCVIVVRVDTGCVIVEKFFCVTVDACIVLLSILMLFCFCRY